MTLASLLLAVGAVVPSSNQLAVDEAGDRIALSSGPFTVAIYEHRDDRWVPLAAGKVAPGSSLGFVGKDFIVNGEVRHLGDRKIAEQGTPVEALAGKRPHLSPLVAGDLVFFSTDPIRSRGRILSASEGTLKLAAEFSGFDGGGVATSALVAFSGTHLVRAYPGNAQGCAIVIFARGDGSWTQREDLRPADCQPGGDDFAPTLPASSVISVALDGDRMALGTTPFHGLTPSDVLIYRHGKDGWKEQQRVARPAVDVEGMVDGFVPHGFGHRVVLQGPRLFIGDGYSSGTPSNYSSFHNGVFVMAERGGKWELEKYYIHDTRQATFGTDFEVRGNRLFIDSPNENAVYVFEHRDGEWKDAGRVPALPDEATENTESSGDEG